MKNISKTLILAVVMDELASIKVAKDSTFAMLLAAQAQGWTLRYLTQQAIFVRDGQAMGHWSEIKVFDDESHWYEVVNSGISPLSDCQVILMRKDPPFDMNYIYTTYILELAEREGCLVVNKPQSLRDANEKLFTTWFPQCCPPSLVTSCYADIRAFLASYPDCVIKPLDRMGGSSIFRVSVTDVNVTVILEEMTQHQTKLIMIQRYIADIDKGDKRILMIDGEPVPYALARIPKAGDFRGNLAAGGRAEGVELSSRDRWICEQVAPVLKQKGLLFVGLDVIGDYLTEINVTSPTCIRELDALYRLDIAGDLINVLTEKLT